MPSTQGAAPSARKLVAISDVHLGQRGEVDQYSLLGQVVIPLLGSDIEFMRTRFAETIRDFARGDAVTLVSAGDLFDLSLSYLHDALEDFVALIRPLPEIREIVFVCGNHDAHMWSLHENYRRAIAPMLRGDAPDQGSLYEITDRPVEIDEPLERYIRAQCPQVERVFLAYPTYEHVITGGALAGHLIHVTHGHLFGGLYTALSKLFQDELAKQPASRDGRHHERLAATVNLSVIELVYWLLGETGGGLGADGVLEKIYHDLQNDEHSRMVKIVKDYARPLLPRWLRWPPFLREKVLDALLKIAKQRLAEGKSAANQSMARHQEISATREQLRAWLDGVSSWSREHPVTVVYGHTHRADQWEIADTRTTAYNLGSWLVERRDDGSFVQPEPRMLLVDRDRITLEALRLPGAG